MNAARRHELIVGGLGGQGVLTIARLLSKCAQDEYEYVTWFPQYMATMRGGPCYSTVIFSDDNILSPIISHGQVVMVMEGLSLTRYRTSVRKGGIMIGNSSLLKSLKEKEGDDHKTAVLPASDMALEAGSAQCMNFVMFGAYLKLTRALPIEVFVKELKDGKSDSNLKGLEKGYEYF